MDELAISGVILGIVLVGGLLYLIFIGYTIYHLVTRNKDFNLLLWLVIILVIPFIGSILYWILSNRNSKNDYSNRNSI